jgi:hypothetical protein
VIGPLPAGHERLLRRYALALMRNPAYIPRDATDEQIRAIAWHWVETLARGDYGGVFSARRPLARLRRARRRRHSEGGAGLPLVSLLPRRHRLQRDGLEDGSGWESKSET